jgi:hypothetical protein
VRSPGTAEHTSYESVCVDFSALRGMEDST